MAYSDQMTALATLIANAIGTSGTTSSGTATATNPYDVLVDPKMKQYAQQIDQYIRGSGYRGAITDQTRASYGFPTLSQLQGNYSFLNQENQTWAPDASQFATSASNTPYLPTLAAPTGFQWAWVDPDYEGANPGNWTLTRTAAGGPGQYSDITGMLSTINDPRYSGKFWDLGDGWDQFIQRNTGQYGTPFTGMSQANWNKMQNPTVDQGPPSTGGGGGGGGFDIGSFLASIFGGGGGGGQGSGFSPQYTSYYAGLGNGSGGTVSGGGTTTGGGGGGYVNPLPAWNSNGFWGGSNNNSGHGSGFQGGWFGG